MSAAGKVNVATKPVDDVQVKYGSKVLNRNVIWILFITGEQSLITVAKLESQLRCVCLWCHCNDCESRYNGFISVVFLALKSIAQVLESKPEA